MILRKELGDLLLAPAATTSRFASSSHGPRILAIPGPASRCTSADGYPSPRLSSTPPLRPRHPSRISRPSELPSGGLCRLQGGGHSSTSLFLESGHDFGGG
jgi:hypothetical protein